MGQFEDLELADKIFYPLLVIFGLPANVLTIIVLVRQRRAPGGAKSTSSLYLIALAVADSLVLIFIVLIERVVKITILDRQVSFGGFCPWLITLDYTASNASTWIIIAYTIERFTGVYYPVWKHKFCKPVTTKLVIAGVFVLSWLCSLPHFFAEEARSTTNPTKYLCDWKDELSRGYKLALIWGQSFLSYTFFLTS
ncbi:putative G-protein coupled receptor 139 [Branchiostoma floridae x Branchiostoma japonicum]